MACLGSNGKSELAKTSTISHPSWTSRGTHPGSLPPPEQVLVKWALSWSKHDLAATVRQHLSPACWIFPFSMLLESLPSMAPRTLAWDWSEPSWWLEEFLEDITSMIRLSGWGSEVRRHKKKEKRLEVTDFFRILDLVLLPKPQVFQQQTFYM